MDDVRRFVFKKILAHKIVLFAASQILQEKIRKSLNDVLELEEDPNIFQCYLELIYCGIYKFNSINEAIDLFKCGTRYRSSDVTKYCLNYLKEHLAASCIPDCFELSLQFNLVDLQEVCLRVIKENAEIVLHLLNSNSMNMKMLNILLDLKELSISEYDFFKITSNWIKTYIRKIDETRRHEVYKQILPKFCFFGMTREEFVNGPIKSGLLEKHQSLSILCNLILRQESLLPMPDGFSTTRRKLLRRNPFILHEAKLKDLHLSSESLANKVLFEVDKTIEITSFSVFTRNDSSGTYMGWVKVLLGVQGLMTKIIAEKKGTFSCNSVYTLQLGSQFKIKKGLLYELEIKISDGKYRYWNVTNLCGKTESVQFKFYKHPMYLTGLLPICSIGYVC
ncbi:uncharacterized protein LOC106662890 isoform X2 [Cimex lectularius]|uniref:BTB domain-containing protein n=1 Tax=Cimex lectularius TaxID=79782 RepID=A0A8I6RDN3_CIMLE|nr:uncharacterized protein LOC106662890 isoform X2 [Cimex lectularius]